MTPRVTIIGGGSAHWTPTLLVDFANTPSLQEADVVLMDIDAGSLPPMADLCDHIVQKRGIGLKVRTTTDLEEALDGPDYVVTALSVGGFASMRHDIEIPARYGLRPPVGDSVGPGGISRALRSMPVLVDVARQMERRCPDALLLNVSNPLTALCRAVTRETSVNTVGLCNEVIGQSFMISLLLDADMRKVEPVVAGVNHLPLITELRVGGEDGFKLISELVDNMGEVGGEPVWMAPPPAAHLRKVSPGGSWTKADVVANLRVKLELFRRFGVLPGSSDTHVVEFLPGFVTPSSDYGRDWGVHQYGILGHQEDKEGDRADLEDLLASEQIPSWSSGELVAPLIDAMLRDSDRRLPVNLPNTGQVKDLGGGVVVECMAVVGKGGPSPSDSVTVPSFLGEQLRRIAYSQELTVDAGLEGDRTKVLEAMLADPMGGAVPYEHVVSICDELLAATSPWLPQFGPGG